MEVPLARRKIDRRDRIAAAALLVPPAGIVQLNHALHNKLQLNIYSIGDQNAFSTTFFFPFLFFPPPFSFGLLLLHASEIIYRRTPGTNSLYLDQLGSGSRVFFYFFSFFLLSSFDIYHVSRRNERECVFRGIDASVAF